MKKITVLLYFMVGILAPSVVVAHTSEIFFAEANANNSQNRPAANVMILLDTSGSMRLCETGTGTTWCNNVEQRRIEMLESAMHKLIDSVSSGVRIGLARFRDNTMNNNVATGGYVLMPVVDVNERSREMLKQRVSELNSKGGDSPRGGTPTAMTYWESALYMMGRAPSVGNYSGNNRDNNASVCVEEKDEQICEQVFDRWDWQQISGSCDTSQPNCSVVRGSWSSWGATVCDASNSEGCETRYTSWANISGTCEPDGVLCRQNGMTAWQNLPAGVTCNTSASTCQRTSNWSSWVTFRAGGATASNCPAISGTGSSVLRQQRRSGSNCQERFRVFQQRTDQYQTRSLQYRQRSVVYSIGTPVYRTECRIETSCVKTTDIVRNGQYVSPMNMNNQCESNHIVIFTDGAPTAGALPNNMLGGLSCSGSNIASDYACQVKISNYLNARSNLAGREIKTYNVGLHMGTNRASMEEVSSDGADGTYTATDADSLAEAFISILDMISEESRSISAPGVAVNQMSRLQHLGQLYYSVFQPEPIGVWQGNLKRYRLEGDMVVDARGSDAVDDRTGYFREGSKSFWNSGAGLDGADATLGGARERLKNVSAGRQLYYIDEGGSIRELTETRLEALTTADLGIPGNSPVTKAEVVDRLRKLWADPLHSVPVMVNYDASGPDEDDQTNYVFVSTNGGMLHAIDTSDGTEKYAIMPYEMFSQAFKFAYPEPLNFDNSRPTYGLDGSWVAWRRANMQGTNKPSAVYLYGGMRRGGRHYYAMDVSDPDKPASALKWKIDQHSNGFDLLGQTWSTPTMLQLRIDGASVPALVFGGGYSPDDHDKQCVNANNPTPDCNKKVPELSEGTPDQMGRAVYIVNALTGELIWSASRASQGGTNAGHTRVDAMKWGVPGSIAVVDLDLDGYADHLYFGDLGAQIFRVDLNAAASGNSEVVSRVVNLAKFTEGGSSGARRFFEAPAVAYVEQNGQKKLVVATASGYRAHPLDRSVEERIYVVHDDTVFQSAYAGYEAPATIGTGDLLEVTNLSNATDSNLAGKKGWVMYMDKDGEKAMASPTIFNGRLLLTTYSPNTGDQDPDPCKVRYGTSYLYVMDLMTSRPAALTNDGTVGDTERRQELASQVPVSQPQIIGQEDGKVAVVVGTEVFGDVDGGNMDLRKRRWYPLEKNAANEFVRSSESDAGQEDGD